jgi:hypothetical protein
MDPNTRALLMGSSVLDTGNSTPATLISASLGLASSPGSVNLTKQTGDLAILMSGYGSATPAGWTLFGTVTVGYYPGPVYYRTVQSGDGSYSTNLGGYEYFMAILRGHTRIDSIQGFGSLESGTSATRSFSKDGSILVLASDRGATSAPTISGTTYDNSYGPYDSGAFITITRFKGNYDANTNVTIQDYSDTYSTGGIIVLTV